MHISSKVRRVLIPTTAALALLIGACILLWSAHWSTPCRVLPFAYDYLCFAQNIDHIYKTQGPASALAQLDTLPDDLNYGASHLIAHQLGHALFADAGSVEAALDAIPYTEYSPTELFRYGGVVHGIFHSYFLFGSEREDVHTLITHACAGLHGDAQLLVSDCAHGVGHGLMAYTDNDVRQTLLLCDESIQPENCSRGAFMERGLLYIPGYADTTNLEDVADVCASLESDARILCAEYSGWTAIVKDLVQTHTSDTTEALQVCGAYEGAVRDGCISVAARDLFSIVYDNDSKAMVQACNALSGDADACLHGLNEWEQWDAAYHGTPAYR